MAITGEEYKRWRLNTFNSHFLCWSGDAHRHRHTWPGLSPNTSWPAVKQTLVVWSPSNTWQQSGNKVKTTRSRVWLEKRTHPGLLMTWLWREMTDRVSVDQGVVPLQTLSLSQVIWGLMGKGNNGKPWWSHTRWEINMDVGRSGLEVDGIVILMQTLQSAQQCEAYEVSGWTAVQ